MSELLLEKTGGLRIGRNALLCANFNWPLAKLKVYREKVVLTYLFFRKEFYREDIVDFERFSFLFFKGLRINHRKSGVSRFILFFCFGVDDFIDKLRELGFNVKE